MVLLQNGSTPTMVFLMVDEADDETAETGLSPAVSISKNGGAFAACTNAVSAIGNGWYKVTLTAAETNTDGPLIIRATAAGADEWRDVAQVYTTLLSTSEINRLADILFRRSMANVENSANGETLSLESLYGLLMTFMEAAVAGSTKSVYRTNGSTLLGTQVLTTSNSAVPVVGITSS